MKFAEPETIKQLRLTFDSDFRYPIRITMSANRQGQQRIGIPAELVKDYTVELVKDGKTVKTIEVKNNHQRLNVLDFEPTVCDSVKVNVIATNGADRVTVYEVRAY